MTRTSYVPTVDEVGALIHARTKDQNGNFLGTFTGDTRPTAAQVNDLIAKSTARVRERLGGEVADALALSAREAVALRVAALVELSFFGDQITAGRSPYAELKALADDAFTALVQAWKDLGSDQEAGTEDDLSGAGLPVFEFPLLPPVRAPGSEIPGPYITTDWGV